MKLIPCDERSWRGDWTGRRPRRDLVESSIRQDTRIMLHRAVSGPTRLRLMRKILAQKRKRNSSQNSTRQLHSVNCSVVE